MEFDQVTKSKLMFFWQIIFKLCKYVGIVEKTNDEQIKNEISTCMSVE